MISVTVELHSAITGETTTLGTMLIANDGTGTMRRGNYIAEIKSKTGRTTRTARVENHARLALPVWSLLKKLLVGAGY